MYYGEDAAQLKMLGDVETHIKRSGEDTAHLRFEERQGLS
jgi:hypothetical protein